MNPRVGWRALARHVAGESTSAEAAAVEAWAARSPANAELLASARTAWREAASDDAPWDTERAWGALQRRLATHSARRRRVGWLGGAAAAAAAVVLLTLPARRAAESPAAPAVYATGEAEQRTVRLADGSVARLAPGARLRVAPGGAREAWLEGTAFFGIAERDGAPFVVHTAAGDARVLGTRFELRASGDAVQLAVLEGTVVLSVAGREETVEPGRVSVAVAGAAPTAPTPADVEERVDWMGNVLIFQATPLRQAVEEIGRRFGARLRIEDAALAERTLTAVFENRELPTVVSTVCRVVGAECVFQDSVSVILR